MRALIAKKQLCQLQIFPLSSEGMAYKKKIKFEFRASNFGFTGHLQGERIFLFRLESGNYGKK